MTQTVQELAAEYCVLLAEQTLTAREDDTRSPEQKAKGSGRRPRHNRTARIERDANGILRKKCGPVNFRIYIGDE